MWLWNLFNRKSRTVKKEEARKIRAERDRQWAEFSESMAEICSGFYLRMLRYNAKPSALLLWYFNAKYRRRYTQPCLTISPPNLDRPPYFHVFADGSIFLSGTPGYYFNTAYPGIMIDLIEAMAEAEKKAKESFAVSSVAVC